MKLKLDLHIHSEASVDGRMTVGEIVAAARARGLDGVAICDHNALSPSVTEFVPPEGFVLIPGEEFSTERGHVLGLFLTEPIGSREFDRVVAGIKAQGGIAVLAHPFERTADTEKILPAAEKVDGIEVKNGRANRKNRRANAMARELADRLGLPCFAGSDAHVEREIGNCFVTVDADGTDGDSLKRALLRRGNSTEGQNGRETDVARSELVKLKKRKAGPGKRIKWLAFAAKCAAGDLFKRK